jgi:hypothetical protein
MTSRIVVGLSAVAVSVILWGFHDRYWYPTDDGLYAHVAERLVNGAVLQRDVQDIHPGLIHFLHAAAFMAFGIDLVSLRYPLMAVAFAQAMFALALVGRRDIWLGAACSVAVVALGVVQFLDPTPNWYCLAAVTALAGWMTVIPVDRPGRLLVAGVLTGLIVALRQLTGVWVAMGVLAVALFERESEGPPRQTWVARLCFAVMLAALLWYLTATPETEPGGVVLIAVWPLLILGRGLLRGRTSNAAALRMAAELAAGGVVPLLPILGYHLAHGSVDDWFNDNVAAAFGNTQLEFFGSGWYGVLPLAGLHQALTSFDAVQIVNGFYWLALPLLFALNGVIAVTRLHRSGVVPARVSILAAFFALVALYLEGPLYLYYGVGFVLTALLFVAGEKPRAWRTVCAVATLALSVVAVVFHAGQTRLRTPVEILQGRRVTSVWSLPPCGLPRCSLRIDEADRLEYARLLAVIERETGPDDTILALPIDPELYFLADRRSSVRFYNSALGIHNDGQLQQVVEMFDARPPKLVAVRPDDKFMTDASRTLMALVRARYTYVETTGGLEFYRRKEGAPPAGRS